MNDLLIKQLLLSKLDKIRFNFELSYGNLQSLQCLENKNKSQLLIWSRLLIKNEKQIKTK